MPMRNLLSQLLAIGPELALFILTSPLLGSRGAYAIQQKTAESPNLDLDNLGRVAVAGDFDSISVYTYVGQNENVLNNNGSSSLLTQYPNGAFDSLAPSDGYIEGMCQFNGEGGGVIVGGNFTSLGGVEAQSIARWNPNNGEITAMPGLSGSVRSVYCDNEDGTVYVGGSFSLTENGDSQNAVAWTGEWTELSFAGFNGPVYSITKNSAGRIVFGGDFDGLGNATSSGDSGSSTTQAEKHTQVVNLAGGDISAEGTTTEEGFDDPKNIICKTGDDGPGDTWLLSDNRGGFWEGTYTFGFVPTKLRLYNTAYQGRGTKSFAYENMADAGFLSLRYVDADGNNSSCSGSCPLPEDDTSAQDFFFNQPVGTSGFRLWINEWYGDGAGFSGVELFQDDIYSFAVNDFNEPTCDGFSQVSSSIVSPADGLWERVSNNGATSSDYLSASLTDPSQIEGTSVVFTPDIEQSGNYSITFYTPGCLQDDSCATRGTVNLTGSMTSEDPPVTVTITQTNDYDKYDSIYIGSVDLESSAFAPTVTLSPIAGGALPQTIVAQRVRFEFSRSTGGLNGLYEYNADQETVDDDFSGSVIDKAGADLNPGAVVNSVVTSGSRVYVAGKFNGNGMSNVMSIGDKPQSLPAGGLNDNVNSMYIDGSTIYIGGNFTDTDDSSTNGLANVAAYNIDNNEWTALGAGVDGQVMDVVPLALNITVGNLQNCITVNGDFTSVNAYDGNDAFDAEGFAIWVPSQKTWLNNISQRTIDVYGKLMSSTEVSSMSNPLYAGQLSAQALGLSGAAELIGSDLPYLQSLGVNLQMTEPSLPAKRKRNVDVTQNYTGVYTGLFFEDNDLNITVLGGHFASTASDGSTIENLVFIKDTDNGQKITGISQLDSDSTIGALAHQDTLLFAGGSLTGEVDGNELGGIVVYDLQRSALASTQPPALSGDNPIVNVIAPQEDSTNIFVGGSFEEAGALPCETLCYWDTSISQWNTPGPGLSGNITSMFWTSKTELIIAGEITVDGNDTRMATYDSKQQVFQEYEGAASLPGGITALTPANGDYDHFWAAGIAANNGSAYLSYYSDGQWTGVGGLGPDTIIRGLQVLSLTSGHDDSQLVSNNEVLMIVGNINIPNYGNASACLFDGSSFEPFILTNKDDGSQGTIAGIFVSKPQNLMDMSGGGLAIGFIVLIGLAIALGLIFLIVVAGILMERSRRRREGYVQMNPDKNGNLQRIPPETLFSNINGEKTDSPKV